MSETDETHGGFKEFLVAKSANPNADLTVEERVLYSLLSLPVAAQEACSEAEREYVIETVKRAMQAAIDAPSTPSPILEQEKGKP